MKLKFSEIITVKTRMIVRNPETASVAAEIKIVRIIGSCGSGSLVDMGEVNPSHAAMSIARSVVAQGLNRVEASGNPCGNEGGE